MPSAGIARIADHYSLSLQGSSRVAGRLSDVISLSPKDAYRYGYRLWLDKETGLPLRAEIVGAHRQVLEWAAFSDITIGVKAEPQRVLQGMRPRAGWRVKPSALVDANLAGEGWAVQAVPAGFQLIRVVKRAAALKQVASNGGAEPNGQSMLQLIFSDGMTYVSLFIEPAKAYSQRQGMLVSMGATQTLMVRRDAWWLTAMGNVPAIALKEFLASLRRLN
ncbi:sigma factor AlgU regulatory protein MucB precursor [mine drainage metagenome]|uniref:Sigma factor AlgU regulatory protein MucB n=1 Tax=mine drainage metagenome TaxID=410659 RepID=A0A1J5PJU7_9ZZZZ